MAKLYFRHGAMRSAKTLNLLAVAHNYGDQGKKVLVIKPKVDDRYGIEKIQSRAGLSMDADIVIEDAHTKLDLEDFNDLSCILVDEAHFLPALFIDRLRMITLSHSIPVICYGLRTDFRGQLFAGSKRLMELADSIEEVKVTCQFCNSKAVFNMRFLNGKPTISGEQIQIGGDESYAPVCYSCYHGKLGHPLNT